MLLAKIREAARRQLKGFGTIISFDVRGDAPAADAVCAGLQLIQHATSLGAVESTIERRASIPGQEHLPPALLRLSVGIEAVERYVISSPRRLRRLLDEVDSPNLQVIYDPVNLLWSTNCEQQAQIIEEAHALLGNRICIVHAKDFAISGAQFQELPAGQGRLDYRKILRWIKEQKPGVDVLMENTHPATIDQSVAFLRSAYRDA